MPGSLGKADRVLSSVWSVRFRRPVPAIVAALLLAQLTQNEAEYWRMKTGVTPENVCLLRALDLNPCPDAPARPQGLQPENGWGDTVGHYD